MEGDKMWEAPKVETSKEIEKKHPEQMEDEIFLGMYDGNYDEEGDFVEGQESDERQTFEDIEFKSKRGGTKNKDGFYPLFVKKSEFEE